MLVLVVNSGSSSIKYQLFDMTDCSELASGLLAQIGETGSHHTHRTRIGRSETETFVQTDPVRNHREAIDRIVATFEDTGTVNAAGALFAIGHRVVHGGEAFREPTLIDAHVVARIREGGVLAPLHNPANLLGIEVALERRPDVPQVAVFDTAFHNTLPPHAFLYALPYELYETHRLRRYGFHGTSHQYAARSTAAYFRRPPESLNLIVLHLGNGASATAIEAGKSIDTSMGLGPLEGLMMGTRCGDLDPTVLLHLKRESSYTSEELESLLNKESGLKGIAGVNDMREIERRALGGDERADLAIDMYCYRVKKYIGMYMAVLGNVDSLVFTAGIGENSALIRSRA